MALTERQEYKVEVIPPYSVLQVRRADIVERDGEEIARSYHRHRLTPGSDYSNEPAVVRAIALSLWSPDLVTAYENANYLGSGNMENITKKLAMVFGGILEEDSGLSPDTFVPRKNIKKLVLKTKSSKEVSGE